MEIICEFGHDDTERDAVPLIRLITNVVSSGLLLHILIEILTE